jgi:hypothetical protein
MKRAVVATALLLSILLTFYPLSLARDQSWAVAMSTISVALVGVSLFTHRWPFASGGLGLFILEYAVALHLSKAPLDTSAPVVGLSCLLLIALLDLNSLFGAQTLIEPSVIVRRIRQALAGASIGAICGWVALVVAAGTRANHLLLPIGVVAGVTALGITVTAARKAIVGD